MNRQRLPQFAGAFANFIQSINQIIFDDVVEQPELGEGPLEFEL